MKYRFHLVCPLCGKESDTWGELYSPAPHVNCGDCLFDRTEVAEMKVVSVDKIDDMQDQPQ